MSCGCLSALCTLQISVDERVRFRNGKQLPKTNDVGPKARIKALEAQNDTLAQRCDKREHRVLELEAQRAIARAEIV